MRHLLFFVAFVYLCGPLSGSPAYADPDPVEIQLRNAVLNSEGKLGTLEPWQKALFTDEVVPQFQRFVRDYRPSGAGLVVDVDQESLRRYLSFYAPKMFKQNDPQSSIKILVMLKPDLTCLKCVQSTGSIQRLIQARLQRRGLSPLWVSPESLSSQSITQSAKLIFDQLLSWIHAKGAMGVLLVNWGPAPQEDADSAHGDEKRFIIETSFQVGDFLPLKRQKELLDNELFESVEGRLLTDIFTDLGSKIEAQQINLPSIDREEILIEVKGIRDFNQFVRVKSALTVQLKDFLPLEERVFSKSQVVFALSSAHPIHDHLESMKKKIGKLLGTMSLDPGNDQRLTAGVR